MNLIIVEDKVSKKEIHIQLEYKNNILFYCGYYYDNGKITLTSDIKKYFSFLKIQNKKYIENYNGYEVCFDEDTNLKYFYKNNIEDYYMFFLNNGEDISLNDNSQADKSKKSRARKFVMRLYNISVTGYLTFLLMTILAKTGVINVYSPMTYYNMLRYADNDAHQTSVSMIEEMIGDSPRLNA